MKNVFNFASKFQEMEKFLSRFTLPVAALHDRCVERWAHDYPFLIAICIVGSSDESP
jgi:hypothetical protein